MRINLLTYSPSNRFTAQEKNRSQHLFYFKNEFRKDSISFKSKVNYLTLDGLIKKLTGINSIEDKAKIEKISNWLIKKLPQKTALDSIENFERLNHFALNKLLNSLDIKTETIKNEIKYIDEDYLLDKKSKTNLKKIYTNLLAAKKAKLKYNLLDKTLYDPVINDWFKNSKYKSDIPNAFMSLFAHPIDKAKYILGDFSKEDLILINKIASTFSVKNPDSYKYLQEKSKILNQVNSIINSANFVVCGDLKKAELTKLKKLVLKNEAFNKISSEKSLYKDLETIIFNPINKLSKTKVGDYINNLGLIINKIEIYDVKEKRNIPCVIVFDKLKNGQGLRVVKIDPNFESDVQKIKDSYLKLNNNLFNSTELIANVEELNKTAKQRLKTEKELHIAQVDFRIAPINYLETFLYNVKNKEQIEALTPYIQSIEKVKNGEPPKIDRFTMLLSLINADQKKYHDVGKKLSISLMHLLKHNDLNDIFLIAHAIGEKSNSPLPLYLRAGFKPIFPSEEIINQEMQNMKKWEAKKTVYMYLPQNSMIYNLVDKIKPLNKILSINSSY